MLISLSYFFIIKCTILNDQFKKIIMPNVKVIDRVLPNLMVTTRFSRVL